MICACAIAHAHTAPNNVMLPNRLAWLALRAESIVARVGVRMRDRARVAHVADAMGHNVQYSMGDRACCRTFGTEGGSASAGAKKEI